MALVASFPLRQYSLIYAVHLWGGLSSSDEHAIPLTILLLVQNCAKDAYAKTGTIPICIALAIHVPVKMPTHFVASELHKYKLGLEQNVFSCIPQSV
jgi:hypothetical protein